MSHTLTPDCRDLSCSDVKHHPCRQFRTTNGLCGKATGIPRGGVEGQCPQDSDQEFWTLPYAVLSSNEIHLYFVTLQNLSRSFSIYTYYRVDFYTLLSTCNEVTLSANIYFLLRYFSRKHVVTKVEMCTL